MTIQNTYMSMGFIAVTLMIRGITCEEALEIIRGKQPGFPCAQSDDFRRFSALDDEKRYKPADGKQFHIWGDTEAYRLSEGLLADQRVMGEIVREKTPYRLRYAHPDKEAPLLMSDPYDGEPILFLT